MPKPGRKKKQFLRKKDATTYKLIAGYVDSDEEDAKLDPEELEKRKEEQREYGIFYDDEYNYMKHLRSVTETVTMVSEEKYKDDETKSTFSTRSKPAFPFSMFDIKEDKIKEEKIDPEILAALEDAPVVSLETDEDVEVKEDLDGDLLDDDFISKAGGLLPQLKKASHEYEYIEEDDREFDFDDEDIDEGSDAGSFGSDMMGSDLSDDDDDDMMEGRRAGGRGTAEDDIIEAQTALILKNFEEGLGFQLSSQDVMLDEPEMPSAEDYEHFKHIVNQESRNDEVKTWSEVLDDKSERPVIDTKKYIYEDEDEFEWRDVPPAKPKFDCVSILSLNSNTRNLPTDIIPPPNPKNKRNRQAPSISEESVENPQGLTLRQLEQEMRDSRRADRASTFRPNDETGEEKRLRKKAIKDERKERRQEKKANKMVFSIENEKMKKETASLAKAVKSAALT